MQIQMVDLKREYLSLKEKIDGAVLRVLASTQFINGPDVHQLAAEVADYLGVEHAIPCASGTDALLLALMVIDIQPGDEVITTPFTFVATAEVIALLQARPVFVDIDETTYNINVQQIESAITSRTRAIIPVHLYGQAADMDPILEIARKHRLAVIEDAAQAIGARYKGKKVGTFGDMACISFFPSKNLGAYGDAGMVVTDCPDFAEKLQMIANHGSRERYIHELIGVNSRLDSLQAAILRVKLPFLEQWNEQRRQVAKKYTEGLQSLDGIVTPQVADYAEHIFHQYTIRTGQRNALQAFLQQKGIPTAVHYPIPLHLQKAFQQRYQYKEGDFPIAEKVAGEVLSLPMHPHLTDDEIRYIVNSIQEFIGSQH